MLKGNFRKVLSVGALAALMAMPGMVSAATEGTDYTVATDTCTVKTSEGLKYCVAPTKQTDKDAIEKISISEDVDVYAGTLTATKPITVASGKTLTVMGTFNTDAIDATSAKIVIREGGSLNVVTSGDATNKYGIKAGEITLGVTGNETNKGYLTVKADNKTAVAGNTAVALDGVTLIANGTSKVTVNDDSTFTLAKITLNDSSSFVADNAKVTITDGNINKNATFSAKEVTVTKLAVDGKGASLKGVKDTASNTATTLTNGIVKVLDGKTANGTDKYEVFAKGLETINLAANEKYTIPTTGFDAKKTKIVAANGAVVVGLTANDAAVTINGTEVVIEKGKSITIGTDVQAPTTDNNNNNANTNQPTNDKKDETINKNPQTSDNIFSFVGLAVSSVSALAVSVVRRFI